MVRIASAYERFGQRFLHRILTPAEQQYVGTPPSMTRCAARFAAKEAVAKAIGTGIRGFSFRDIEVIHDALGAPAIQLHNEAQRIAGARGIVRIYISLSHTQTVAMAAAVAEKECERCK